MITEWQFKPIDNHPDYIICNDGTSYSCKRKWKILNLKPSKKKKYLRIRIRIEGREKYLWAHRTVAKHFIGDITDKEVHHIDNNTWNNHYTNLKIVTKRENLDFRNINQGWNIKYY
jgi:hypothetical protein